MTKEEAKNKLRKLGYTVVDDNSVVTVLIAPGTSMKNTIKTIKEMLYDWGYNASFAIRQHKGADEVAGDSLDDVDSMVDDESVADSVSDDERIDEESVGDESADDESVNDSPSDEETSVKNDKKKKTKAKTKKSNASDDEASFITVDTSGDLGDDEYYDEEDSDMLLTEESIQFSLEDFGLDF